MQLDDLPTSRPRVKSIHILSHQSEFGAGVFKQDQGFVRRVGTFLRDNPTPPMVPLPDDLRMRLKRFRRGKRFRPKLLPESPLSPERRNPAVG